MHLRYLVFTGIPDAEIIDEIMFHKKPDEILVYMRPEIYLPSQYGQSRNWYFKVYQELQNNWENFTPSHIEMMKRDFPSLCVITETYCSFDDTDQLMLVLMAQDT
jgi:hypothetical protein